MEEKHNQSVVNYLWKNTALQVTYIRGRKLMDLVLI